MTRDLTSGSEIKAMLWISLPMILGNLLQQLYNVVDTLIVGRVLGAEALAAVGSSYTLMVFLTSVTLGFCMGAGVVLAQLFGAKRYDDMRVSMVNAFVFIGALALLINILAYLLLDPLLELLQIQPETLGQTRLYLRWVFGGILFTFLYNFFAAALRAMGNAVVPLVFLAVAALLNIALDLLFVIPFGWGIAGAAIATVVAQGVSALAVTVYFFRRAGDIRPRRRHLRYHPALLRRIIGNSVLTSVQQSVMNFGILLIQGLVNSFGVAVMAAFAAAVKIDSFAYMPVQDFGNAFSTYIAQNHGAGESRRVQRGVRLAAVVSVCFSLVASLLVVVFARQLMLLFVQPHEVEIIGIGVGYLRVEGAFYPLIGCLFLLYGLYRGLGRPGMSVALTVISLGSRVALAYLLAPIPAVGLVGIWWAIPIGWALADATGFAYYGLRRKKLLAFGR